MPDILQTLVVILVAIIVAALGFLLLPHPWGLVVAAAVAIVVLLSFVGFRTR